ncbi:MAG TPA: site-2 protease family protein [Jatrophihabitans sp.]|nr:site-2 protease family protein [Jatrophihabitans sp.]
MSVRDLRRRRGVVRPSPLFLLLVAVAVLGGVLAWFEEEPGARLGDFGVFLLVVGGWLVSMCLHEFAHAYSAYRAGDRSVEARGYLTLNPVKYAHPVLSILLPLVAVVAGGFALPGGAVYLHPHQFRSRRTLAFASAAGPAVNVVLAVVLIVLADANANPAGAGHVRFWTGLGYLGFLQLTAAVLNLLPIPGLDGYGIIEPYLDPQTRQFADKVKPWGLLGVMVLLFYAGPIRDAFFDLVDWLYGLLGGDTIVWQLGYQFFKFWVKQPL